MRKKTNEFTKKLGI